MNIRASIVEVDIFSIPAVYPMEIVVGTVAAGKNA
jgi:hypothetical protein